MRSDKVLVPQRTNSPRLSESASHDPRMFGRKMQRSDVGPVASERPRRQVAQRVAQVASKVVRALSVRKRNHTDTEHPHFVQNYRTFGSASQMLTQPMHTKNGRQSGTSREISRHAHRKEPGSQGRLAQSFPYEARTLERDFVCSLDHAGTRWYGRMYVCRSSVCFTGAGISLGTAKSTNTSVVSLPTEMRPKWLQSFQSVQHANTRCEGRKIWRRSAVKIAFVDVTRVSKEMTLGVCPNALTVATARHHYIFTNFMRRDCAFGLLAERWQQAVQAQNPDIVPAPAVVSQPDPAPVVPEPVVCESELVSKPELVSTLVQKQRHRPHSTALSGRTSLSTKDAKPLSSMLHWCEQTREPIDPIELKTQIIGTISHNTKLILLSHYGSLNPDLDVFTMSARAPDTYTVCGNFIRGLSRVASLEKAIYSIVSALCFFIVVVLFWVGN